MDLEKLKENLKSLDLNEKEADIYLFLVRNGSKSSTQISKGISIPKTTIYRQIENLIKKGLVVVDKSERGDVFEAITDSLKFTIIDKYEKIKDVYNNIETLEAEIKIIKNQKVPSTSIKMYEGIDGLKQIVWNTLKANDTMYVYTNANRNKLFGRKWFGKYLEEFTLRNKTEKVIEVKKDFNKYPYDEYEVYPKFLKNTEIKFVDEIRIKGEIMIYNDVYAMFNFENDKYWGFELHDESFVSVQRSIFEKLWNTIPSISHFKQGKYIKIDKK